MRRLTVLLLCAAVTLLAQAGDASAFTVISAASLFPLVAPDSLAWASGSSLAPTTEAAVSKPLPVTLGGVSVQVVDGTGTSRPAPLISVSPQRIVFVVPAGTAEGTAAIHIVNGTTERISGVPVRAVAPALFSANGDGRGAAAATAVRQVLPTGILSPVPVFQCGKEPGSCVTVPIDLGVDAPVYLSLYGTGLRGASDPSQVRVTLSGVPLTVLFAGPHCCDDGLDQVDTMLPLSLRGSGEGDVVVMVDGLPSNPVRVAIQ